MSILGFDDSVPVYRQITDELRRRILSGQWAPGYRLPLETELAEEFGVARMTMNKALAILQRQGFIVRRKRLGTVVNHPNARVSELRILTMRQIAQRDMTSYETRLLQRTQRATTAEERMLYGMGVDVLELRLLHLIDKKPASLEIRLICLEKLPQAAVEDFCRITPEEFLLNALPWASSSTKIAPITVDITTGGILEVRPGTAALQLERSLDFDHKHYAYGRLILVGGSSVLTAQQVALN